MANLCLYQKFAINLPSSPTQGFSADDALVLVGTTRFGPPGPAIRQVLEMASQEQLQTWAKRLLDVKSWPELVVAA